MRHEDLPPCPYGTCPARKNEVMSFYQFHCKPQRLPYERLPVTFVLLSGGIGDYTVYGGIGDIEWVSGHGEKLPFQKAERLFPGIIAQRYRGG